MSDASSRGADARTELPEPLLLVRAGAVWLALSARLVDEVCEAVAVTRAPRAPAHVDGLLNLRGHAVPVMSLRRFLGLPEASGESTPRVVVVAAAGMRVGLACEAVRGVVEPAPGALRPPDSVQGNPLRDLCTAEIDGPGGRAAVLDVAALLEAARVPRDR